MADGSHFLRTHTTATGSHPAAHVGASAFPKAIRAISPLSAAVGNAVRSAYLAQLATIRSTSALS